MQSRISRIPDDWDTRAEEILRNAPDRLTAEFLDSLSNADQVACSRYGAGAATLALRTGSVELLRAALLAKAIATLLVEADWHDTLTSLAVHNHVAQELGVPPARVFSEVADRLLDGGLANRMRLFGARPVRLERFGWRQVATPDGPDFIPPGPRRHFWPGSTPEAEAAAAWAALENEFQDFGRVVARTLGCIVNQRDIGLVPNSGFDIRNTSWSSLVSVRAGYPVARPSPAVRFMVAAMLPPFTHSTLLLEAWLLDPTGRQVIEAVAIEGWTTSVSTVGASGLPPAEAVARAAMNVDALKYVTTSRGDGSTAIRISACPPPELLTSAVGYRNLRPRPATADDLRQLRALTERALAALAATVDAEDCLPWS